MCNRPAAYRSLPWRGPAPKKTHIGAFRKVCSTSLKIGEQRSTDSGINTLTRPQDSQLYPVQASSRPSHRVVRDFPAWLLELGKGRRKWRQDVVEGLCAAWRARAQSRNPPKDSLNGANRFKKTKEHTGTQPPNNSSLSSPSVETGIWDRSHRGWPAHGFRVF